jgi:hypothetical protein
MFYRVFKSAIGVVTAQEKDGFITIEGAHRQLYRIIRGKHDWKTPRW